MASGAVQSAGFAGIAKHFVDDRRASYRNELPLRDGGVAREKLIKLWLPTWLPKLAFAGVRNGFRRFA